LARYVGGTLQRAFPPASVFVASHPGKIPPGDQWLEVLRGQLSETDTYFALLTPRSIGSRWVWVETGVAWFRDIRIIPLVAGGLSKSDIPSPLSPMQAIDLTDPEDAASLFRSMASELPDAQAFCATILALF
jgi:TIR domain